MHLNVKSSDRTGALVTQLKLLSDDLEFQHRVGKDVADIYADYPHLRGLVAECLNHNGTLNVANTERLERAGFMVVFPKGSDEITIHLSSGHVRFNISESKEVKHLLRQFDQEIGSKKRQPAMSV